MASQNDTRAAIATEFKKLVVHETNKATVSSIAKKCGISRKAFYYHFSDTCELSKWIYRCELGSLLLEHCPPRNLVYLPVETRLKYPEYPFYAHKHIGIRQVDSSQFFDLLKRYLEENRSYYKMLFWSERNHGLQKYAAKLLQLGFQRDIRYILGGRHLPENMISQLSRCLANSVIANYLDALLYSNRSLSTVLPKEFTNVVNQSLTGMIDNFFAQRENVFDFFEI